MLKDEYKGRGGAYIFDPKTGKRRRDDEHKSINRPAAGFDEPVAAAPAEEAANKPKGGAKQ